MINTNRAMNRVILFVVGLLMLVLGAVAVAVIVWPNAAEYWASGASAARNWLDDAITRTVIGQTQFSWLALGAIALIALVVIMLLVVLFRLGGGRSRTVVRSSGQQSELGRVTVRDTFVSEALKNSLDQRDEILLSHVSVAGVRKQSVIHLSVTPRQNTSPLDLVADLDRLVTNLSSVTGEAVPTYISLHTGLRARLARDQRRLA